MKIVCFAHRPHNPIEPRETKAGSETKIFLGRDSNILISLSWLNFYLEQLCNIKFFQNMQI